MNDRVSSDESMRLRRHARTAEALTPVISGTRIFGARYSRFVGTMKVVLPLTASTIAGLILAWPSSHDEPPEISLAFAETRTTEVEIPGMANARYVGTDGNNRPYLVTANKALQDPKNPNLIDMTALQADMTLDNDVWMSVVALSGQYDRGLQTLQLTGPISIFSDIGYEFHTESAYIDLQRNSAQSNQPVRGHGPFGTLKADGFSVVDQGKRLLFHKNVRMTIQSNGDG